MADVEPFLDRFSYSEQHRARQQIVSISYGKKNLFISCMLSWAWCFIVLCSELVICIIFVDCSFRVSCRSLRVWLVVLYTSMLIVEID